MKAILLLSFIVTCVLDVHGAEVMLDKDLAKPAERGLVDRHDKNGNGKIDAHERKVLRREIALSEYHKRKYKAEQRVKLNPVSKPLHWWDRELLSDFDKNKDGILDAEESKALPKDRLKAAQDKRRLKDSNGDGIVSEAEAAAPVVQK